jgi:hypothetical protein
MLLILSPTDPSVLENLSNFSSARRNLDCHRPVRSFLADPWYDGDAVPVREALQFDVHVIASDNGMRRAGVDLIPGRDRQALIHALSEVLDTPKQPRLAKPDNFENLERMLEVCRELV